MNAINETWNFNVPLLPPAPDNETPSVKLTLRSPDEILAMQFDDSDIILGDRIIASGQNVTLCGASSVGKSRLAMQLAVCCITGRKFLKFDTRGDNLKWLFVQAENSNRRLQFDLGHLRQWIGGDWAIVNEKLVLHTLETDSDGFLNLDDEANRAAIHGLIQDTKPDVCVYDSLYNFQIGDLNKDQDMSATLRTISQITKTGNPERVPLVLHHAITGRAGAAKATGYDRASFSRNSKVLHAWTRGQINVSAGSPDNNDTLILSCGKCSNGREFEPFAVKLNPDSFIYEPDPGFDMSAWESDMTGKPAAPLMSPDRVRELCPVSGVDKPTLAKSIMEDCGCYRGSAYRYITKAERLKQITFNKTNETYFRK